MIRRRPAIKDNRWFGHHRDVSGCDECGLQMIEQMKISPNAAFIILSGYQEFEYVKRPQFAGGRLFG